MTLGLEQPAIALVDDDFHSARLLTRMLAAHGGPHVERMSDPEAALKALSSGLDGSPANRISMVIVDLKSSSTASQDFIVRLKHAAPNLLVVAMAQSLERSIRNALIDAGAAAVFERHGELNAYRREAANIVGYWVRSQRLDAVGT
ncbi:MAG TPA: response regulator [Devosia sp.]|nr:response regulator [Devosia sp.]